jgi:hypothetical protein
MMKSPRKIVRDKICSQSKRSLLSRSKLRKLNFRNKRNSLLAESKESRRSKRLEMLKDVRETPFLSHLREKEKPKLGKS